MANLTPNFTLEEFTFSETATRLGIDNTPSPEIAEELKRTAEMLEQIRAILGGRPVRISSGYRCLPLNRQVRSADTSAHILGQAADFTVPQFGSPRAICHKTTILEPTMPRNFTRSSSGVRVSTASWTTRHAKLSHVSSRLR